MKKCLFVSLILVSVFLINSVQASWWDTSWYKRILINISEPIGVDRILEPVDIQINLPPLGTIEKEARLTMCSEEMTTECTSEIEIPSQIYGITPSGFNLMLRADVSPNSWRAFYLYYDNPSADYPDYGTWDYEIVGDYYSDGFNLIHPNGVMQTDVSRYIAIKENGVNRYNLMYYTDGHILAIKTDPDNWENLGAPRETYRITSLALRWHYQGATPEEFGTFQTSTIKILSIGPIGLILDFEGRDTTLYGSAYENSIIKIFHRPFQIRKDNDFTVTNQLTYKLYYGFHSHYQAPSDGSVWANCYENTGTVNCMLDNEMLQIWNGVDYKTVCWSGCDYNFVYGDDDQEWHLKINDKKAWTAWSTSEGKTLLMTSLVEDDTYSYAVITGNYYRDSIGMAPSVYSTSGQSDMVIQVIYQLGIIKRKSLSL